MRNTLAILRRDLGAYFTSPIGYIFMMVFVTITVGLYITSFFAFPTADMRPYFDNIQLVLCIFIPAVTMRVWAEERKENTWEMLLTFPMKASELVLGKFLAALVFFCATLVSTVTIPAMLFSLGDPDPGAIFSGYLGTLFLGAFFLSLGIFFSGFFKDQIVAFVVTLMACFMLFLLGTTFIASYVDDVVPGLGSLLSNVLGVFSHYGAFTRGVIELGDVLFFVAWTAIFLWLNMMYIDGRNRPKAKVIFGGAVGLCIAIGLMFNYLVLQRSIGRFDMTEEKLFTVSEASKQIMKEFKAPAQVKLYISPKEDMPTATKDLERDIVAKLDELKLASGGNLEYNVIYLDINKFATAMNEMRNERGAPEAAKDEKKPEDEALEKRLLDKGIQPFTVQAVVNAEMTTRPIYASLVIGYAEKAEEVITPLSPQVIPELEYQLVSKIYKMSREKMPVIALVAPKDEMDPQMRQMLMQMGREVPPAKDNFSLLEQLLAQEKYDVKRVSMTKEEPLPDEYDTLVVINPRTLNDRQRWEIARALNSGKNVVLAVQEQVYQPQPAQGRIDIGRQELNPDINPLLEKYGLGVSKDLLMDTNHIPLSYRMGSDLMSMLQPLTINPPMQIVLTSDGMTGDTSITNQLSQIFYFCGTALDLKEDKLKELNLTATPIAYTSNSAWTASAQQKYSVNDDAFRVPGASQLKKYPVIALVEGQFPDAFKDTERPKWPKPERNPNQPAPPEEDDKPEAPAKPVEAKPARLLLLGCAQMFRDESLQMRDFGHIDFFMNAVDALTLDKRLVDVRGRKQVERMIAKPEGSEKTFWRLTNYGLANLIIAAIGVAVFVYRRSARNAYTMSHSQKA